MTTTNTAMREQQLPLFVPAPSDRLRGWVMVNDPVVIVEVNKGEVFLLTGHIASSSCSHVGVDNVRRAVVWGDQAFNEHADDADDAHERGVDITNPHLLKLEEWEVLRDKERALVWFGQIHPPDISEKIAVALSGGKAIWPQTLGYRVLHLHEQNPKRPAWLAQ